MKKKVISCILFVVLTITFICGANEVLTPKASNRYYILEKYLKEHREDYRVEVFGSCHAYTSFHAAYVYDEYGISSFVFANPGEIIPVTYVRMKEEFEISTPDVVLVETWGINAYDTYDMEDNIFEDYLPNNVERLPLSLEKIELMQEYDLSFLEMCFPIARYKDRVMDHTLTGLDFQYSFDEIEPYTTAFFYEEMTSRLECRGFKKGKPNIILDYPNRQSYIEDSEYMEIEEDIKRYINKIIDLCDEYDVELIFYRSPYVSNENELKKLNHFKEICEEQDVLFIDLEEEIEFSYIKDFIDYEHLSEHGATKATEYLMTYVLAAMEGNEYFGEEQ